VLQVVYNTNSHYIRLTQICTYSTSQLKIKLQYELIKPCREANSYCKPSLEYVHIAQPTSSCCAMLGTYSSVNHTEYAGYSTPCKPPCSQQTLKLTLAKKYLLVVIQLQIYSLAFIKVFVLLLPRLLHFHYYSHVVCLL